MAHPKVVCMPVHLTAIAWRAVQSSVRDVQQQLSVQRHATCMCSSHHSLANIVQCRSMTPSHALLMAVVARCLAFCLSARSLIRRAAST